MSGNSVTRDDSILKTIAKLVGGEENGEYFNVDLIIAINTAFAVLTQLGVGPSEGFSIGDDTSTWSDFLGDDKRLSLVVTYVHLKTAMIFDPPQSSVVKEARESLIREMEWRSFAAAEEINRGDSG